MLCINIPAGAARATRCEQFTPLCVQEPGRRGARVVTVYCNRSPARQIATIPGRVEYLWHAVKGALNQNRTLIISRSTVVSRG